MAQLPAGLDEGHFDYLGTIEVLVLRCEGLKSFEKALSSSSSAEHSEIFADEVDSLGLESEAGAGSSDRKTPTGKQSTKAAEPQPEGEDAFGGGLFSLLDGPSDEPPLRRISGDAPSDGYDGWGWQPQGRPPSRYGPEERPQHPPNYRPDPMSYEDGRRRRYTYHDSPPPTTYGRPPSPRPRPERRVHFDHGERRGPHHGPYYTSYDDRTPRVWAPEDRHEYARSRPSYRDPSPHRDHNPYSDYPIVPERGHYTYDSDLKAYGQHADPHHAYGSYYTHASPPTYPPRLGHAPSTFLGPHANVYPLPAGHSVQHSHGLPAAAASGTAVPPVPPKVPFQPPYLPNGQPYPLHYPLPVMVQAPSTSIPPFPGPVHLYPPPGNVPLFHTQAPNVNSGPGSRQGSSSGPGGGATQQNNVVDQQQAGLNSNKNNDDGGWAQSGDNTSKNGGGWDKSGNNNQAWANTGASNNNNNDSNQATDWPQGNSSSNNAVDGWNNNKNQDQPTDFPPSNNDNANNGWSNGDAGNNNDDGWANTNGSGNNAGDGWPVNNDAGNNNAGNNDNQGWGDNNAGNNSWDQNNQGQNDSGNQQGNTGGWANDNQNAAAVNGQSNGWDNAQNGDPAPTNQPTTWNNNQNSFSTANGRPALGGPPNIRVLYGPHGAYFTSNLARNAPPPDVQEEPRYDVPQAIAQLMGVTKQVQPGPGYKYTKKRCAPRYIDTVEEPYAKFVFKYRTKEQLKNEIGVEIAAEPTGDEDVNALETLDKAELIQLVLRAKGALGGTIPEPPPRVTPPSANGFEQVPIVAPDRSFLGYNLPPGRRTTNTGLGIRLSNASSNPINGANANQNNKSNGDAGNWQAGNNQQSNWNGGGGAQTWPADNQQQNTGGGNNPAWGDTWGGNNSASNNNAGWDGQQELKPSMLPQQSRNFSTQSQGTVRQNPVQQQSATRRSSGISPKDMSGQGPKRPSLNDQYEKLFAGGGAGMAMPRPPSPPKIQFGQSGTVGGGQTKWDTKISGAGPRPSTPTGPRPPPSPGMENGAATYGGWADEGGAAPAWGNEAGGGGGEPSAAAAPKSGW